MISIMKTKDLNPSEYNPFYSTYIDMIPKELKLVDVFIWD